MLCVRVLSDGLLAVVDPQPVEVSGCANVLISGAQVVSLSPFALSVEQGAQISVAVIGVWSVAFVVRLLLRVISIEGVRDE